MGFKERVIYDDRYYQLKAIIESKSVREWVKSFRASYARFKCPIPPHGFKDAKAFQKWLESVINTHRRIRDSKTFRKGLQKITVTAEKENMTAEERDQKITEYNNKYLPLLTYPHEFDKVLELVGLDPQSEDDQRWVEQFVFFGRKESLRPLYAIKWYPPDPHAPLLQPELWIRIFGYTKLSDLPADEIEEYQRFLPDYVGKNKKSDWRIIRRDWLVVACYNALRNKKDPKKRDRRPAGQSIDVTITRLLKKNFSELNAKLVKRIVARHKKEETIGKL